MNPELFTESQRARIALITTEEHRLRQEAIQLWPSATYSRKEGRILQTSRRSIQKITIDLPSVLSDAVATQLFKTGIRIINTNPETWMAYEANLECTPKSISYRHANGDTIELRDIWHQEDLICAAAAIIGLTPSFTDHTGVQLYALSEGERALAVQKPSPLSFFTEQLTDDVRDALGNDYGIGPSLEGYLRAFLLEENDLTDPEFREVMTRFIEADMGRVAQQAIAETYALEASADPEGDYAAQDATHKSMAPYAYQTLYDFAITQR